MDLTSSTSLKKVGVEVLARTAFNIAMLGKVCYVLFWYRKINQSVFPLNIKIGHYPDKKPFNTFIEPAHEIMALFVLHKLILQTRMRSHPVGLDVWFLVGPFVYFHTLLVRTAKALARLRRCAGSPEPSLFAYVISTIISRAGSIHFCFNQQRLE